jgi:hypothetical protein
MPLPAFLPSPPSPPALIAAAPPAEKSLAAPGLPADAFPAYTPPKGSLSEDGGIGGSVETFDPVARALLITNRIPRYWRGTYRAFERGAALQPVQVLLDSVVANGQMVVLRGRMLIAEVETPFQGNLNAKSDQIDLLPLAGVLGAGLEPGGEFQGLQGLSLSGWHSPRLTSPGGRLQMVPAPVPAPVPTAEKKPTEVIRGLW